MSVPDVWVKEGLRPVREMLSSMTGKNQTHTPSKTSVESNTPRWVCQQECTVHTQFYNYAIMHHRCPMLPLCSSLNVLRTISYHPHCSVKTDGRSNATRANCVSFLFPFPPHSGWYLCRIGLLYYNESWNVQQQETSAHCVSFDQLLSQT